MSGKFSAVQAVVHHLKAPGEEQRKNKTKKAENREESGARRTTAERT